MPATISIQPAQGFIRAGRLHASYGDPWEFCVAYKMIAPDHIFLFAGGGELSRENQTSMYKLLTQHSIKKVTWERIKNGEVSEKTFTLRKHNDES